MFSNQSEAVLELRLANESWWPLGVSLVLPSSSPRAWRMADLVWEDDARSFVVAGWSLKLVPISDSEKNETYLEFQIPRSTKR